MQAVDIAAARSVTFRITLEPTGRGPGLLSIKKIHAGRILARYKGE